MIARIRKSIEEKDQGFTLIELLVVIIIIGILAAIAIPVFLNQRKKGWDAAIKSDLKNAATAEETMLTDQGYYDLTPPLTAGGDAWATAGFKYSAASDYDTTTAQSFVILGYDSANPPALATGNAATGGYCMSAKSASGNTWYYNSLKGGLQPAGTNAC